MKSKSVLITISHLGVGGTEIQTLNTVRALICGGYKVVVLCLFRHIASVVEKFEESGAKVYCASPQYANYDVDIAYPHGFRLLLFLYKNLRRVFRKENIGVVHVQYMTPAASVILVLRYLLFQRNIIATAHTAADIYKDLRLLHFIQRHCLRAFTCITERAERSFFGSSQLYTTETVLGKRNHFTIYNALPKATALQSTVKVCANEQESNSFELLQRVQPKLSDEVTNGQQTGHPGCSQISHTEFTEDTEFSGNADIISHDLDLNSQNARIASLACASGVGSQSHADSTDCTEDICQRDNTEFRHDDACFACVGQDSQRLNVDENLFQDVSDTTTQKKNSAMSAAPSLRGRAGGEASVLGVVSRLEPIKGMDLVVPAFAEVLKKYPNVRLVVVGDGSLRATMEQQAVELGCADRITWVGRQPQEELAQWYGQMDIVLMPSRSEGFGLTAIEAMANGCVMVASNVGGLPEVVRDGVCGLLHCSEDVKDMAAKITQLLSDRVLYDKLRSQSLCEVKKYSFERYATLVNNWYDKLLEI